MYTFSYRSTVFILSFIDESLFPLHKKSNMLYFQRKLVYGLENNKRFINAILYVILLLFKNKYELHII